MAILVKFFPAVFVVACVTDSKVETGIDSSLGSNNGTMGQISTNSATLVTTITNRIRISDSLLELYVRFVSECAQKCALNGSCRSFFYNPDYKLCQLQDILYQTYNQEMSYLYRSKYYKMAHVISNFTCPLSPPGPTYDTVLLPDNTIFTYRIVQNMRMQADAMADCGLDGAWLVRVLSYTKLQALINIFTTCPDHIGVGDYWIDGGNAIAQDFFNITQWTTSVGNPLPTSNQFWAPGEPKYPDIDHCIAMFTPVGYQWFNQHCDMQNYFICEK